MTRRRRKHREPLASTVAPSVCSPLRIAATIAQHAVPLLALPVLGGEPFVYLALVLFDLGVSYAGPQLLSQGAPATREFVAFAEGRTERLLAWLLMPMLMIVGGLLFVATAALFLLPVLVAGNDEIRPLHALSTEWKTIVISIAAIGVAAALRHDREAIRPIDSNERRHAGRLADQRLYLLAGFLGLAVYAFALGNTGLWLLAIVFAVVQCIVDLRHR